MFLLSFKTNCQAYALVDERPQCRNSEHLLIPDRYLAQADGLLGSCVLLETYDIWLREPCKTPKRTYLMRQLINSDCCLYNGLGRDSIGQGIDWKQAVETRFFTRRGRIR